MEGQVRWSENMTRTLIDLWPEFARQNVLAQSSIVLVDGRLVSRTWQCLHHHNTLRL